MTTLSTLDHCCSINIPYKPDLWVASMLSRQDWATSTVARIILAVTQLIYISEQAAYSAPGRVTAKDPSWSAKNTPRLLMHGRRWCCEPDCSWFGLTDYERSEVSHSRFLPPP